MQASRSCRQVIEQEAPGNPPNLRFEDQPVHSWKRLVGKARLLVLVSPRSSRATHCCSPKIGRAPKELQVRRQSEEEEGGDTPVCDRHTH